MMNINFTLLAHYATCARPYFDLIYKDGNTPDIAFAKLEENINKGECQYLVAEGPDYCTMHDLVEKAELNYERKAFMDTINNNGEHIEELYKLYVNERYDDLEVATIGGMAEVLMAMAPEEKERFERLQKEAAELAASLK